MRGARRDRQKGRAAAARLAGKGADALLDVVGSLLPNGPEAWIAFDEETRRLYPRSHEPLRSDRIEARLCHPDGRIRASALTAWPLPPLRLVLIHYADQVPVVRSRLRRMLGASTPPVWQFPPVQLVVIRCADRAPEVRNRARRVLARIVAQHPEPALVALTPLALRLGRREHGAWAAEQLEAALSGRYSLLAAWWRPGRPSTTWSWNSLTGEQRAGLLDRLRGSGDLPTRRFAARLTLDTGRLGVRDLARQAAAELDPVANRMWTDAALAAMAADGPDDEAIDILLGGRLPSVRAAGVTALRRAGRAAEATAHLTDRSGTVRACARWLVRQDGGDPESRYREILAAPERVSRYAVTGFCECVGHAGAPLLRALLDHPVGAVRAAALAGLRRLDVTLDDAALLPMLDDPSASVAREAARCLRPVARRLDSDALASRTAPERAVHTRRAAFHLLRAQGGIAALRASVALSSDPDPGLHRLARSTVCTWNWLGTLQEGQAERTELGALLARSAPPLGTHALRWWRHRLDLKEHECPELDARLTRSAHDDRRRWRSRRDLWD
ncbi:hypothetical protein AB0I68_33645 [Streptomyces sp. NPDC050448]|uniref:hypothetical protein n=1 Tax=Streptomyces sp. NPDC050448 TaxID=3155404 RepID=UPI0034174993